MRRFPVLRRDYGEERRRADAAGCPDFIPWDVIESHATQALRNHDQSLDTLAERGGLAPCEMVAVLEDRDWRPMSIESAVARLKELTP